LGIELKSIPMKKIVFGFLFCFAATFVNAQDFDKIANTELKTTEDCKKAEADVLKLADYVFATPAKPDTQNRILAFQFILMWMEGTEYTFRLGEDTLAVTNQDEDLLGMYLAALSKVTLENSDQELTDQERHEKATQLLAAYCSKKENQLKPTKELKKVIKKMKRS